MLKRYIFLEIILTKFIKIDMMAVQASEKRMRSMIITKETDYALRILRVLLDGEKLSEVADTFDRMQSVISLYQALGGGRE